MEDFIPCAKLNYECFTVNYHMTKCKFSGCDEKVDCLLDQEYILYGSPVCENNMAVLQKQITDPSNAPLQVTDESWKMELRDHFNEKLGSNLEPDSGILPLKLKGIMKVPLPMNFWIVLGTAIFVLICITYSIIYCIFKSKIKSCLNYRRDYRGPIGATSELISTSDRDSRKEDLVSAQRNPNV